MPADPESTNWLGSAMAVFGLGGGGGLLRLFTTQSAHGARIGRLEEDRSSHANKIENTHTTVTQLDTKFDGVASDVTEIRGMLERYGREQR